MMMGMEFRYQHDISSIEIPIKDQARARHTCDGGENVRANCFCQFTMEMQKVVIGRCKLVVHVTIGKRVGFSKDPPCGGRHHLNIVVTMNFDALQMCHMP